jgi:hypothetical protein
MENWEYLLLMGIPAAAVLFAGYAYGLGAFSTTKVNLPPEYSSSEFATNPEAMKKALYEEKIAFRGDDDTPNGGRRKKTKKSKSKNKKTKRRR